MVIIYNRSNIIVDAVSTVHLYKDTTPVVHSWEATHILGSDGKTLWLFASEDKNNNPDAVYATGEYDLPDDYANGMYMIEWDEEGQIKFVPRFTADERLIGELTQKLYEYSERFIKG